MIHTLDTTEPVDDGHAQARVVDLLGEQTAACSALSARTARDMIAALQDDPTTMTRLADRVDTSLQNVQYHVQKLEAADLVTVVDSRYSEKGREMDVFAATADPLVLVLGADERTEECREALHPGTDGPTPESRRERTD